MSTVRIQRYFDACSRRQRRISACGNDSLQSPDIHTFVMTLVIAGWFVADPIRTEALYGVAGALLNDLEIVQLLVALELIKAYSPADLLTIKSRWHYLVGCAR